MGIQSDNEFDPPTVPTIQMAGIRKVRVSPNRDAARIGADQVDGLVNPFNAVLVTRCIAGPVDQIENFLGIGQTHDERRIAPDALIGNVHALFAFSERSGNRTINVNEGFFEEVFGLLLPHTLAGGIDRLLKMPNIQRCEAASKVSSGCWIGQALRTEGIEKVLILAAKFKILKSNSTGDNVVRHAQDVITLMIRKMNF